MSTAVVAPTSRSARAASFRPTIAVEGQATRVLVEQLRAVDIAGLEDHVGHLAIAEQSALDDALRLLLGM